MMTVDELGSVTLKRGGHATREAGVCLMELVAWLAGEPHSAKPACVCPVLAAWGQVKNDSLDDEARQSLKALAPRFIGTRSTPDVEQRRAWLATDWLVRVNAPAWLRVAGLTQHAERLEALPELRDEASARAAVPAVEAAWAAARDVSAATRGAVRVAAWDAARSAAIASGWAAARVAAWDAARAAARAGGAAVTASEWACAWASAWGRLEPTVTALAASEMQLIERMIAVTEGGE